MCHLSITSILNDPVPQWQHHFAYGIMECEGRFYRFLHIFIPFMRASIPFIKKPLKNLKQTVHCNPQDGLIVSYELVNFFFSYCLWYTIYFSAYFYVHVWSMDQKVYVLSLYV